MYNIRGRLVKTKNHNRERVRLSDIRLRPTDAQCLCVSKCKMLSKRKFSNLLFRSFRSTDIDRMNTR